MPALQDLTDQEINHWTVIKHAGSGPSGAKWLCRCRCGTVKTVPSQVLRDGRSRSCRKCCWTWRQKISARLWASIKWNAKKRGIPFEISKQYAAELYFDKQRTLCALTGRQLFMATTSLMQQAARSTASLDRIDSAYGYIEGNVQWVHKDVNIMKGTMAQQDFINLCATIAAFNGPK